MGKRSKFKRVEKDCYDTIDPKAVVPLLPHLKKGVRYVEPCAGKGDLIHQLAGHAECVGASDIAPRAEMIAQADALEVGIGDADVFITNPPWTRALLHPLIVHLSDQAPTWLLFDAAWHLTGQAAPFMERCRRIVVTRRLKWIPDTTWAAMDDTAWHLFDRPVPGSAPTFYGLGVPAPEAPKRARRMCFDCGGLIDRFGKWRLQPRNGALTPVHISCRYPSSRTGKPPVPAPMPLFDGIQMSKFTMAPDVVVSAEPDYPENVVPFFRRKRAAD